MAFSGIFINQPELHQIYCHLSKYKDTEIKRFERISPQITQDDDDSSESGLSDI